MRHGGPETGTSQSKPTPQRTHDHVPITLQARKENNNIGEINQLQPGAMETSGDEGRGGLTWTTRGESPPFVSA